MLAYSRSLVHFGSFLTFGKIISPYTTKEYPYDRKSFQEIMEVHLDVTIMIFLANFCSYREQI